jgi:hypothetical protein
MEFGLGFSLPKKYTTFRWLGDGTKVKFTRHPVKADELDAIKGRFKIKVLGTNSVIFNEVFLPLKDVTIEKPFLKSYGF